MQKTITIRVPAVIDRWNILLNEINSFYLGCFHECSALRKLLIALEELFVNSANYAYDDSVPEEERLVEIIAIFNEKTHIATIQIMDSGVPYNPLLQQNPDTTLSAQQRTIGGLGIFMVKKLTDSFTYTYEEHKNKNVIQKKLV